MNKMIAIVVLAAVFAVLAVQPDAMAQEQPIYKWVDAEGVVHYTARPPEDVEYEQMGVTIREPEESAGGNGETGNEPEVKASDIPPEQPEMAASEPDPEMVAERCAQARSNIENLTQRTNVLIRGEDGERRQITDEERAGMLQQARDFIEEWC